MELEEFIQKIDVVSDELSKNPQYGLCTHLSESFGYGTEWKKFYSSRIYVDFESYFGGEKYSHWFGHPSLENLSTRLQKLEEFKQHCLMEDLYEEY